MTHPLYISHIHEIPAISPTNTFFTFQANHKAGNAPRQPLRLSFRLQAFRVSEIF